jgi:hypothetical protein
LTDAQLGARQWWAMISPAPTLEASGYLTTPHDAGRVLRGPEQIGPLSLTPASRQLVEYIRTLQVGWMQFVSWPVIVEGYWVDDEWEVTERKSSKELHKLCCLVSLLWNEAWQVRVGPQRSDGIPVHMLDDSSAPAIWHPNDVPQRGLRGEVEIPLWAQTAWSHSYFDPQLTKRSAALSLWREGKLLQPEHPSFALVAFTASLERAGKLFIKSGELPNTLTQSGRRFWATVDLVATPADAALLRKAQVYDRRSAAAHGEQMPGLETLYGPVLVPPFLSKGAADPVGEFVHQTVRILADVARNTLLRVFGAAS